MLAMFICLVWLLSAANVIVNVVIIIGDACSPHLLQPHLSASVCVGQLDIMVRTVILGPF